MHPVTLDSYKRNVTSQFGEDGIIEFLLSCLPGTSQTCVEFGAWDGKFLSNTWHLVNERGFQAVLIEGDPGKHAELAASHKNSDKVETLCAMVDWEQNNLDLILSKTKLPKDFDLLSIDIDGNDYHVWKSCRSIEPKIVCIEYNPTIATGILFVQPPDHRSCAGVSISTLVTLGVDKGYDLVAVTRTNAIFIRKDLSHHVPVPCHDPAVLRTDCEWVTHIFFAVDGSTLIQGNEYTPWHGVKIRSLIRRLPNFLLGFPPTMPVWRRKLLGIYKKFVFRS